MLLYNIRSRIHLSLRMQAVDMYESSFAQFYTWLLHDDDFEFKNRYCRKEISTVNSQSGAESIAELNNQTLQSQIVRLWIVSPVSELSRGETLED